MARLADRVDEQLRLIDENLDLVDATAQITQAEQQLTVGEDQLIEHEQRLEELRVESASRPELEEHRDGLERFLEGPIFAEHTRWYRERTWVQGRQDWVRAILDSLPESIPPPTDASIDIEESSVKAVLQNVQEASDRILEKGKAHLGRFRERLAEAVSELDGHRTEWNTAFETAENQYRAHLAELGAANLAQAADELRSVEQELARIEASVEPEIKRIESEIASLEDDRATLLKELGDARSAIACSRSEFVADLNKRLGGTAICASAKPLPRHLCGPRPNGAYTPGCLCSLRSSV